MQGEVEITQLAVVQRRSLYLDDRHGRGHRIGKTAETSSDIEKSASYRVSHQPPLRIFRKPGPCCQCFHQRMEMLLNADAEPFTKARMVRDRRKRPGIPIRKDLRRQQPDVCPPHRHRFPVMLAMMGIELQ